MMIRCSALYAPILEEWEFQEVPVVSLKANDAACPITLIRGGPIALELDAPNPYDIEWSFSGGPPYGGTVNKAGGTSWGDGEESKMVAGGTVTVTFKVPNYPPQLTRTCVITVNPRNGFVTPAMDIADATEPPAGQLMADLTTPPTQADHLGGFAHTYEEIGGYQTIATVASGPNEGYIYFVAPPEAVPYYRINADLVDTNSDFYKAQCGMNGYISGADLLTQTRRHEYNHAVKSHLGYTNTRLALADANHNYGVYLEGKVLAPGGTQQQDDAWHAATIAGLNAIKTTLSNESQAAHGTAANPHVNYDEDNNPIGNVNRGPLIQCLT